MSQNPPSSPAVWAADVPVSMPVPPPQGETTIIDMYGFGMTQFRLVHNLTQREYEQLSVPVYQPVDLSQPVSQDDIGIDTPAPPPVQVRSNSLSARSF